MSQEKYDEYEEGFRAGEEAAAEDSAVQKHIDVWMGRYAGKSETWWKGFNDGKEGNWDPPEEEAD